MTDEIKKIRPDFTGYSETTDEKLTFFGVLNRFYIYDIEGTKSRVGGNLPPDSQYSFGRNDKGRF